MPGRTAQGPRLDQGDADVGVVLPGLRTAPPATHAMVAAGLGVSVLPKPGLPVNLDATVTRPLDPRVPRRLAVATCTRAASPLVAQAYPERVTGTAPTG